MKIPINTEVLRKYNLSLGQFLVLLSGYYELDYNSIQKELVEKGLVEKNLFSDFPPILSNNTKNFIAKILVESDDKLLSCPIKDFHALALKCQDAYPNGIKPGKTYPWRSDTETIVQKLQTLVVKYDFLFTEKEALSAIKQYVASFTPPYTFMHTLKNFLLYVRKDGNGKYEMESMFMTIIENNRENNENNN